MPSYHNSKSTAVPPVKSSGEKLIELAQTLQFSWFVGHSIVILSSLFYGLTGREWLYRLTYLGVLESFGIITYQHFWLKPKSKDTELNMVNLLQNENVLYFTLSLLWFLTPSFTFTLLPYSIFALFHALNYLKNTLLPQVFNMTLENSKVVVFINKFINDYNERCMHWVGTSELSLLLILILRILAWYPRSLIVIVLYSVFIKLRYENSKYMKTAFAQWRVRLDGVFAHPSIPPQVKLWYSKGKMALVNLSKYSLSKPIVVTDEQKKN